MKPPRTGRGVGPCYRDYSPIRKGLRCFRDPTTLDPAIPQSLDPRLTADGSRGVLVVDIGNCSSYKSCVNSELAIALHVVGFLTARQGQPLTSTVLAQTYGTSPVVVRRVLAKLNQAGLVESRRGVGGGSLLSRDPATINLRQVYEAIADKPQLLRRHPGDGGRIARILADYINDIYDEAERALLERLESVTVQQMDATVQPRIVEAFRQVRRSKPSSRSGAQRVSPKARSRRAAITVD